MNESPHAAVAFGGLEQDVRSKDVALGEIEGIPKTVIDVGLRREMHDGIDPFLGHDVRDQVGGGDVSLDEFEVFETGDVIEVGEAGAVVKFVVDYDVVLGVFFRQEDGDVGPDEAYSIKREKNHKQT